jgi:uncharacterized protein
MKKSLALPLVLVTALGACAQEVSTGYGMSDVGTLFDKTEQTENASLQRAVAHHHGKGVSKNHAIAKAYYEAAIREGDTRAMNDLGVLMTDPTSTEYHPRRGFQLFERAARQNNASARFNLGIAHYYGFGPMQQDRMRGLDMIATSANQGHPKAQSFLVEWIRVEAKGEGDVLREKALALADSGHVRYWEISHNDSPYASLWGRFFRMDLTDRSKMLSDILAVESGCETCADASQAQIARNLEDIENMRAAAARGERSGLYNLGLAYLTGENIPVDREKGARLIVQSADQGYIPAQYMLGKIYYDGLGIRRDRAMAYAFFALASGDQEGFRESKWAQDMLTLMEEVEAKSTVARGQAWASAWTKNSKWYLEQ